MDGVVLSGRGVAEYPSKKCEECGELFEPSRANSRFCSVKHGDRFRKRAGRKKRTSSARRGDDYPRYVADGWALKNDTGVLTPGEISELTGLAPATVSRYQEAWREDRDRARARDGWVRPAEFEAMLEPSPEAFAAFRARFFRDEKQRPYLTPAVHKRWIEALLGALDTGGRQLILSPPRHGKSQLLVHFVIWLICRNPNVRIIWVGGNEDIARMMVGAVLDELENNLALAGAMLGPGGSFRPAGRSGKSWSSAQLTVGTRTATGIKSPTLVALGKGGKILSRDADWVVFDDIVDHSSVISPASRNADASWLNTQLSSRKEEHTAMSGIGSRQHHDDLWGRLIENQAWSSIVERAHDPECPLPVHGPLPAADHLECVVCAAHVDCLLFPELRTMRWLQDQRTSMADDSQFEMVYQNITRAGGADYLTVEDLRACRNPGRGLGLGGLPAGCRLIAGMDPATAGFQASVLWAWDPTSKKRWLVDIDNRRAGGLPGAELIIKLWFELYGVRTWVIESMYFQDAIRQHHPIVEFCSANGITLLPHITDRWNKWDRDFGVTAQFQLFKSQHVVEGVEGRPLIDLPYGDAEAVDKVRVYEQQLLNFEPQAGTQARNRRLFDVGMAGWFPETQIRLWSIEMSAVIEFENGDGYADIRLGDSYRGGAAAAWNVEVDVDTDRTVMA